MPASSEYIQSLVLQPREALMLELKTWIDPTTAHGRAKVVKALIALRNNDGGYLAVGFNDKTGKVDPGSPPTIREQWHPDVVQSLVAKYCSEPFEVFVHFPDVDGLQVVVLEVEPGIRSPVAAKQELSDQGKTLVAKDRVYVRTVNANHTVSTSEATWQDWRRLCDLCFANREADIGSFVRRHLAGISAQALASIRDVLTDSLSAPLAPEEQGLSALAVGSKHFEDALADRKLATIAQHGSWEVAAVVSPELPARDADQELLNTLLANNPRYSSVGLPSWADTRSFGSSESRPFVLSGAWQMLLTETLITPHIEFWRLSPDGKFYLRKAIEEDIDDRSNAPKPLVVLDLVWVIRRTAESLGVALALVKALTPPGEERRITFTMRWRGIKGRQLLSWYDHRRNMFPGKFCHQPECVATTAIGTETDPSALVAPVIALVQPLFLLFDGFRLSESVYADVVSQVLKRQ